MKTAIAITAAGLMSLGIVGTTPARAYHLIPENTDFTGTGTTSATKNGVTLQCKAKFQGHTDAKGVGYITGGSFSGQLGCDTVGLGGLPWKSPAKSATKVIINNVSFTSPIGNCGPGNVPVKLVDGVIKFKNVGLAGNCTISGKITTSPTVSIVP
ncbi:MAG TPA: hypothetical protein VHE09_05185 [Rhizomicrobium sp.]|jgi:hypothetical protein|nr:hypothetical protein [Rhizomicrobium sp.]HWA04861.1 hypothetical protein [Rhizomicrobium sp.]